MLTAACEPHTVFWAQNYWTTDGSDIVAGVVIHAVTDFVTVVVAGIAINDVPDDVPGDESRLAAYATSEARLAQ